MYFKQNFFRLTKFQRKIPTRRKHLHNWLIYFNFLYIWYSDYRFYKNSYKSLLNHNLFKYNFIASNYSSSFLKSGSFPFSLFYFHKAAKLIKSNKLLSIPNTPLFLFSTSIKKQNITTLPTNALQFLYFTSQNSTYLSFPKPTVFTIPNFIRLLTLIQLLIFKAFYRLFTLTLLLQ